jgi:hypothetical protein
VVGCAAAGVGVWVAGPAAGVGVGRAAAGVCAGLAGVGVGRAGAVVVPRRVCAAAAQVSAAIRRAA